MIRPTLRQLSYLTALESTSSFSKAAEQCYVTQSTLSAGIKELESILGQKLVNRNKKEATLTPFGAEVCEQSHKIIHDVDRIVARSRQIKAPLTGPLRLGVIPTIAPYFLPQILPDMQKRFPALEIQLYEDLSARIVEQLNRGQLDIILLAFPYETPNMHQEVILEEPFLLAEPKDQAQRIKSLSTKDLIPERLLLLEDGHCLRDHALGACKLQLPKQRKTFSATSLSTLVQMVQHGYGTTLLPQMMVNQGALPDNIAITPFKEPQPRRIIGLAWEEHHPKEEDFLLLARTIKELQ